MALAALVLSSHELHDGFEVLRWQEGGIEPGMAGTLMVRGGPGGCCRFRRGGSSATEVAWASRRGRAGRQRRNGPLERHRCHRLAPGDGAGGTAAWSDIRPVAPCLHADAVCDCPAALAATAQAIYGGVAVGTRTAIITLVSGPLYGALGPRAFWFMALLCAAALPIAFAMRGISINASGLNPIQPAP
jgi:MFS transporter, PPP family, 3-phenylpropionic acid transporter